MKGERDGIFTTTNGTHPWSSIAIFLVMFKQFIMATANFFK